MSRDFLSVGFVPAPPTAPADTDERVEIEQDLAYVITAPIMQDVEVRTQIPADAIEVATDL